MKLSTKLASREYALGGTVRPRPLFSILIHLKVCPKLGSGCLACEFVEEDGITTQEVGRLTP